MDNTKTGALIKSLRKAKNITQKELASLLYITDKAVSKWERGLCAPDIALLEPLSEALGTSVIELIEGEQIIQDEHIVEKEASAKSVLDYSIKEISNKIKTVRTKYISIAAACLAFIIIVVGFILWRGGYFFVIDKNSSPDETFGITVYDKALSGIGFSGEDAVSIIVKAKDETRGELRISYGNCSYQGIWWAPDSKKYVIALNYEDREYLALAWLERNAESNLSAYLSMGVQMNELAEYGLQYINEEPFPEIEYRFLQWSLDSTSMLIYYSFTDINHAPHSGYFWYNCEDGTIFSTFELSAYK